MIINHNMSAAFANRILSDRSTDLQKSMEKLSSGLRINRAGDDASGLAVSENMRAQIRGLHKASQNVQDAESFIQTAEGYLAETTDVLQRMRELAIQSGNGVYSSEDRKLIQIEVNQLVDEIDRVAYQSNFNGVTMLTGQFSDDGGEGNSPVTFHIGANADQRISMVIGDMRAQSLGLLEDGEQVQGINIEDVDSANRSIARLDVALGTVTEQRANLGATQNRLSYLKQGLNIGAENLQTAESRIRDVDMASEVAQYVRSQILTQSSTAMLAQADALPQLVLSLLQ